MVFWLFKKRSDYKIKKIHNMMENSFSNIKKDIGSVSLWINHFKGKHKEHEDSFDKLIKPIGTIGLSTVLCLTGNEESDILGNGWDKRTLFG